MRYILDRAKRPGETLRLPPIDFGPDLDAPEAVTTLTVVVVTAANVDVTGSVLVSSGFNGNVAQAEVTGGEHGVTYFVIFTIETDQGQVLVADIQMLVDRTA